MAPVSSSGHRRNASRSTIVSLFTGILAALPAYGGETETNVRCQAASTGYPVRMLNGLETQRLDANQLVIYPGSAVDNTGCEILNVRRSIKVDIERIGMGGRDDLATPNDIESMREANSFIAKAPKRERATYAGGPFSGKPFAGWYYIILAKEYGQDAPVTPILTRQQSSQRTDAPGSAGVPETFVYRRHLPIAYRYEPDDGFRPMICYGWPKSVCNWTRVLPTEKYLIAGGISSPAPQTIDASRWVPGYGRMLRMEIVLSAGNQGGGAYVSTLGRTGGEFFAGYVNRPGDRQIIQIEIATTSKQTFTIRTDPGVVADIYAVGFSIEQPS